MLNHLVRVIFKERIEEKFKDKHELKGFLVNHERFHLVVNNLIDEIREIEKRSLKFDLMKMRPLINDVADVFMRAALEQKHQQMMSANARRELDAKNSRMADAKEMIKELSES